MSERDLKTNITSLENALKKPPSSPEVEVKVLGAMMLDQNAVSKVIEVLKPEHFYEKKHRIIYQAMQNLYEASEPIDSVSLFEELRKENKLDEIGGVTFITRIANDISSAANVDYHARLILEKWILRQLITTSMEIADSAYQANDDVFDILDAAESKIFQISQEGTKESIKPLDRAVREAVELIEAIHSRKKTNVSVKTEFIDLDEMLGGFQKSDLIIIAARPSMGKTAFALSACRNAAVENKTPIAIFSLEMSAIQLATRLISAEARIDAHKLRTGKFRAEEGAKISRTVHKLSSAPIYIDDTPGLTILELRAKARRLKAEKGIEMIVIDYMQLMSSHVRMDSREREISTISRSLKGLAKELNVPVISLAQLNRSVESTGDKRPMLSHLRESGSIEQDADVVLFLYRPEVYGITQFRDGNSTEGIAEVIISKQRNGPVGDVKLKFVKEYARFENLDHGFREIPQGEVRQIEEGEQPF
jgi:replicative DNA helicase